MVFKPFSESPETSIRSARVPGSTVSRTSSTASNVANAPPNGQVNGGGGNYLVHDPLIDFDSGSDSSTPSRPSRPIIPLCLDASLQVNGAQQEVQQPVANRTSSFSSLFIGGTTREIATGGNDDTMMEILNSPASNGGNDGLGADIATATGSLNALSLNNGQKTTPVKNGIAFHATSASGDGRFTDSPASSTDTAEPLSSSVEYDVSRKMTRWLFVSDYIISRNKEVLENPGKFSLDYFNMMTAETNRYKQELEELIPLGNDGHFVFIAKHVRQFKEHLMELDRAQTQLTQSRKNVVTVPPASTPFPEKLTPFDGDILNWPFFSSTYLAMISKIPDTGAQFRLLYNNLDERSRVCFLTDIDPAAPDLPRVFERMRANFEEPNVVFPQICLSFSKLPPLKHRYCQDSWLALMRAANLAKVLVNKIHFHEEVEVALVQLLLRKLPEKYVNMFKDNFPGDQRLDNFARFCDHHLKIIIDRVLNGLKTIELAIPTTLCPVCEADYHYAEECEFSPTHNCGLKCERCSKDHHVALCLYDSKNNNNQN